MRYLHKSSPPPRLWGEVTRNHLGGNFPRISTCAKMMALRNSLSAYRKNDNGGSFFLKLQGSLGVYIWLIFLMGN